MKGGHYTQMAFEFYQDELFSIAACAFSSRSLAPGHITGRPYYCQRSISEKTGTGVTTYCGIFKGVHSFLGG